MSSGSLLYHICEKRYVKLIVRVLKRISIEWISMLFYMTKQLKFVLSAFYNTLSPLIWEPVRYACLSPCDKEEIQCCEGLRFVLCIVVVI
jgi:hypothetical protein